MAFLIPDFTPGEVLPASKLDQLGENDQWLYDRTARSTTQAWSVGYPASASTATGSATTWTTLASNTVAFPGGRFLCIYEGAGYATATIAHYLRVVIGGATVLDVRADLRGEAFNFPWSKAFSYGRSAAGSALVELQVRPASGTATYEPAAVGLRIMYLGHFGDA